MEKDADYIKELITQIRENQKLLDDCKKHDFGELPPVRFGMRLTCLNCGGKLDAVQATCYTRGFEAAGGNPNEVIRNFK